MAATYRTSAAGGSSSGTGNRTATITPAVGDLLIVYCFVAANTNDTPTCSDNNGSGTYDRIDVMNASISAVNYRLSVFIRTVLMANTTSTVITVATGSNTSGCVVPVAVSGMSRVGADAVRSKGSQSNQAAGTAAPALNQNALTGNLTIAVHGSADTTTTEPTGWTERQDTNQTNDTVALEVATRNSGFTGTTITFGAASSTVFCSHALELDGSALFTRSSAIDGAGAVVSSAAFFSVFARSALSGTTGAITAVGRRELLRSSVLSTTGSILTSATFFSVSNGQALIEGVGSVASSSQFLSVFTRSALLNATGSSTARGERVVVGAGVVNATAAIVTSQIFFSVFNRNTAVDCSGSLAASGQSFTIFTASAVLDAVGNLSTSGTFLSTFERTTLVDTAGSIESSGFFFSIFQGITEIGASGALEVIGQSESPSTDIERSAGVSVTAEISGSGFSIIERASLLEAFGLTLVSAIFFRSIESSMAISVVGDFNSAGQADILRSAALAANGQISSSGDFFSTLQASALVGGSATVQGAGQVGATEVERAILIGGTVAILTAGIAIEFMYFAPRQSLSIGSASRDLRIGSEERSITVETEFQAGSI